MSNQERAQHYLERILRSNNPKAELQKILSDLNSLVFTKTNKPLEAADKIRILEELEKLVRSTPALEKFEESKSWDYARNTQASDNSDILDVISAMKKRVN
jgi:hypothetical protein